MAKAKTKNTTPNKKVASGELHQTTTSENQTLTTNQGTAISDNQNSLKSGARGPTLMEDRRMTGRCTLECSRYLPAPSEEPCIDPT